MQHILVINNDIDTMDLLKNWLEKRDYKVDYTSNRNAVPAIIEQFHPSLIILDVLQKELLPQLKNNTDSSKVPVLLMTGYSSRFSNKLDMVDDIIEKPFNLPLLEHKIGSLMSHI